MKGKIIIDGNKEKVFANSNLIKLISSEFEMHNNLILCNNHNKTIKRTKKSSNINLNKFYGSAIYSINSNLNIYGGEITNNIHEIYIDEKNNESKLPEIIDNDFLFCVRGVALYISYKSKLNIYDIKIHNNKGINNSQVYTNDNSTNLKVKNSCIHQNCKGIGIFGCKNSEINLYKGEISNNIAINNSKTFLISPKNQKTTKISEIYCCIYGCGIYLEKSKLLMNEAFTLKNNTCELNTNLNIDKNCFVEKSIHCAIRGGQIYMNDCGINIKGGIIQNSKNITNIKTNNFDMDTIIKDKKISDDCLGGGINLTNCQNIEISNIKIEKCNSSKGGAIILNSCKGLIADSNFENNIAKRFGGAIFINKNSDIKLMNNKILNNFTQEGSGGGIYAYGNILIDGPNTLISDNIAETFGGGIMIKEKGVIKNGKICHNKALKNSGGGIRVDGTLE